MQTAQDKARNQAQLLISSVLTPPYTREVISEQVDLVLGLKQEWRETVDRDALIKELETVFNVWVGEGRTLEDNSDHEEWLLAQRGSIDWKYWSRYRLMLGKGMAPSSLARLHELTDEVLGRLEAPNRPGAWDRRGMVVGHVQSGKTGNYTGLICKAADAGYKVIVVLAGIHSNLRAQTQIRLDEGFLGYDSSPTTPSQPGRRPVGAGLIDQSCPRPNTITTRHENGDFSKAVARQFSIYPGDTPLLFVIKKNASVLKNLLEWVESAALQRDPATNRPIVEGVPLLVIDDEADNASVDTKGQVANENGVFDQDHDPTVINKRIRRLLHCFEKSAYVGYTATPFANIFIHENGETKDEGEDLFPRSFIINLPAPSNYAGPTKIFGLQAESEEIGTSRGLPLVRIISDHAASDDLKEKTGWMPPIHNKSHVPYYGGQNEVPPSLRRALQSFLLACAARRARGHVNAHNTMLIHVSRFTEVQGRLTDQVKVELEALTNRLRFGDGSAPIQLRDELKALWQEDFVATTKSVNEARSTEEQGYSELSWEQVDEQLADAASLCLVRQINGYAKDVLDYESHKDVGLNVIAIGGDKLARGLTLEGLSVSYFLRASRMYDTLMQMGRWFGYRPGYLDLCRLYMTKDLEDWFKHITEASEELRKEFEHMAITGGTPKDYGLKVQSHPVLMVTSKVKMRNGTPMEVTFAGSVRETIHFYREPEIVQQNYDLAVNLFTRLGKPSEGVDKPVSRARSGDGKSSAWENTYLWHSVSPDEVLRFLENYKFHPRGSVPDWKMIGKFIKMQNEVGELTDWTVALVSRQSLEPLTLAGLKIGLIERGPHKEKASPSGEEVEKSKEHYMIRRLLSPRDEAIDLDLDAYQLALKMTRDAFTPDPARSERTTPPDTASGPMIRAVRPKERGLLLIYPITENAEVKGTLPVIALGVSFPGSKSGKRVTYIVNNIYAEQEFGGDN